MARSKKADKAVTVVTEQAATPAPTTTAKQDTRLVIFNPAAGVAYKPGSNGDFFTSPFRAGAIRVCDGEAISQSRIDAVKGGKPDPRPDLGSMPAFRSAQATLPSFTRGYTTHFLANRILVPEGAPEYAALTEPAPKRAKAA